MAAGGKPHRFPWLVAGLGGLAMMLALVALLRLPVDQPTSVLPPPAPIGLVRLDGGAKDITLQEEAALRDPEVLFMPTAVNAGQAEAIVGDERTEPTTAFRDFQPRLGYDDGDSLVAFPQLTKVPETPIAALRTEQGRDAFRSLGRRKIPMEALSSRFGYMEVVEAGSGQVALTAELPMVADAPREDWAPLQLVAAVDLTGLIGLPAVTVSSGSNGVDGWLPEHLARSYRLGARLKPGIYHISLGP